MDTLTRSSVLTALVVGVTEFLKRTLPRIIPWLSDDDTKQLAAAFAVLFGVLGNLALEALVSVPPDWRAAALAGLLTGAAATGAYAAIQGGTKLAAAKMAAPEPPSSPAPPA